MSAIQSEISNNDFILPSLKSDLEPSLKSDNKPIQNDPAPDRPYYRFEKVLPPKKSSFTPLRLAMIVLAAIIIIILVAFIASSVIPGSNPSPICDGQLIDLALSQTLEGLSYPVLQDNFLLVYQQAQTFQLWGQKDQQFEVKQKIQLNLDEECTINPHGVLVPLQQSNKLITNLYLLVFTAYYLNHVKIVSFEYNLATQLLQNRATFSYTPTTLYQEALVVREAQGRWKQENQVDLVVALTAGATICSIAPDSFPDEFLILHYENGQWHQSSVISHPSSIFVLSPHYWLIGDPDNRQVIIYQADFQLDSTLSNQNEPGFGSTVAFEERGDQDSNEYELAIGSDTRVIFYPDFKLGSSLSITPSTMNWYNDYLVTIEDQTLKMYQNQELKQQVNLTLNPTIPSRLTFTHDIAFWQTGISDGNQTLILAAICEAS